MSREVMVLGAGIVGVSTALQLQLRGWQVLLLDRQGAGERTSFGNAGLIQREAVFPHAFPRALGTILHYASNRSTEVRYQSSMLPRLGFPFWKYWWNSEPERHRQIARHYAALIAHCLEDHLAVAALAGAAHLFRPGGYLQVHRHRHSLEAELEAARYKQEHFAVEYTAVDAAALSARVPGLREGLAGGIHWQQPLAVVDPHALTLAYLDYFLAQGGEFRTFAAQGLAPEGQGWRLRGEREHLHGERLVLTLGAWTPDLTRGLGWHPSVFVKRGYHMHYAQSAPNELTTPLLDADAGYVLAPMRQGLRLTTGAEFAPRDAPPSPIALDRAEVAARQIFPSLGARLDPTPWLGQRPCTSDMLPIIGAFPGRNGLWLNFGHCHQGLTLGPTTGRLLAQLMGGEAPFTDPTPYAPARFS
ncbi:MAG: NAD(P)/FAD-dependent oxidoreductase [Acidithiobacillus sp.]|uniref:NAD(P)/FAD-dependent oxidoreductase n=1 Tax=Acidithiobacillus sp. TaxID=1872118 RepID=UPI003D0514B6